MKKGQVPMSNLKLHNILVDKIQYDRKEIGKEPSDEYVFEFKNEHFESPEDANRYKVTVSILIKDKNNSITLSIDISGYFSFDTEGNMDENIKNNIILKNTIAILFPYIRSSITVITSQLGIKPVILPIININALINQQRNNKEDLAPEE
jgi:preprotein translocase subunit SecB